MMEWLGRVVVLYFDAFIALMSEEEFSKRVYLDFPDGKTLSIGVWCSMDSDGKMVMHGETHTINEDPLTVVSKDQLERKDGKISVLR